MKKVLVLFLVIFILAGCNEKKEIVPKEDNKPKEYQYLLEFEDYKDIKLENIKSIQKIRYTVAGDNRVEVTEKDEIEKFYNSLINLKIGEETDMACEDNTTVYKINLIDGKSVSIEIECDWFVIKGKRYNIVK